MHEKFMVSAQETCKSLRVIYKHETRNKLGNVHIPHQRKSPINSCYSYRPITYSVFIIVSDEEPKEIKDKGSSIKLPNQSNPTQTDVPILQHPDQMTVHLAGATVELRNHTMRAKY